MSSFKRPKRPPSPGADMESIFAMSSMDPEWDTDATYNPLPINLTDQFHSLLTLFTNQMKLSLEKKNKAKNAKVIQATRSQLEKLLSTRSRMLEEARSELARLTQDYLTGYAQELDEIRAVRMAMVQRQEALSELLVSEEKNMVHKPELDRERNSVVHLSAAKADCEDQGRIIASLG